MSSGHPSERTYRLLLRLLPRTFRERHGEEMVGWFRDHAAGVADDARWRARATFWLVLLRDLVRTAAVEHARNVAAAVRRDPERRNHEGGGRTVDGLTEDTRIALRSFGRRPAFLLLLLTTLALGVGSATTVYSVVHSVLLAPLPYQDPGRILRVGKISDGRAGILSVSALDLVDLQERNRSFEALAASRPAAMTLTGNGVPELIRVAKVSSQFFEVLGRFPALGHPWLPEADAPGGPPVIVLGHGIWQRRWGGDPGLVGKTVTLDETPFTVIGIMQAEFVPPEVLSQRGAEAWIPLAFVDPASRSQRRNGFLQVIGKLRPGVSTSSAAEELRALGVEISADHPGPGARVFGASPLRAETVGDARRTMLPLLAGVGLLLAIACINVANLLLIRAHERTHEIAVRSCIGAGRGRLFRQLVTESLLLGGGGGVLGALVAVGGVEAFAALGPAQLPRLGEVAVSGRILLYAMAISLSTSLLFGVLPALRGSKADLARPLGDRGRAGARGEVRIRDLLVVVETSLSIVLVVSGGLLLSSLSNVAGVDPGFDAEGVAVVSVLYPGAESPEEITSFFDDVTEHVSGLPGVDAVGATVNLPLSGNDQMLRVRAPGLTLSDDDAEGGGYPVGYQQVTPGYFTTLRIALRRGRVFARSDDAGAPRVAVVNEALARHLAPDGDALGLRLTLSDDAEGAPPLEIIGVVGDSRLHGLDAPTAPELYLPFRQRPTPRMEIVARGAPSASVLLPAMREQVWAVRPDLPVRRSVDMTEFVARSMADRRFFTLLVGGFALLALTLTVVGVYGTLAFSVSQRRRELGIRLALGATGGAVLRTVLLRALATLAVGIAIGLGAALPATRVLESMLFDVSSTDPLTLSLGVVAVLGAGLAAALTPAMRAARVDPATSLRPE